MTNRRQAVFAIGAGILAGPFAAMAQRPPKTWRIGFLVPTGSGAKSVGASPYAMAFLNEMQAAGFAFGADFVIESRSAEGDYDRLPALAAEFVPQVDILVPISPVAVVAAHKASASVPIVFIGAHDPVGTKMVASLARPGGNMTGLASFYGELVPKHLELVRTILPKVSRVAILANVGAEADARTMESVLEYGKKMGLRLQHVHGTSPEALTHAFAEMARERAGAVIGIADAALLRERKKVAELALKHRLPSIFANRENVEAGGLLSYGENFLVMFTQAAKYVVKIMKGAKPGELPIEQPTNFSLVINRATAKKLGVTIPQEVLLRADEVIEG